MNKIKTLVCLSVILLVASCVSENAKETEAIDPLLSQYEAYKANIKMRGDQSQLINKALSFYSNRYRKELEETYDKYADKTEGNNKLVSRVLMFPDRLVNMTEVSEKVHDNKGCLLVSGTDNKRKRVSVYVGYINEQSWKIDFVNVEYLESDMTYLDDPICSIEILQSIRMEQFMSQSK